MPTSLGSPIKQGSVLDRYVNNLPHDASPPQLKLASSSRLNSSQNIRGPVKNELKNINGSNKENSNSQKAESKLTGNPFVAVEGDGKISKPAPHKVGHSSDDNAYGNNPSTNDLTKEEKGYYEFLCRVAEIKQWIERVIDESLPSEVDLSTGDSLRNGVYLATVTHKINPDLAPAVFPAGTKLQFKHTQNINAFFSLVEHVGLPNSFRFELQDLYNKQDLPQVFETLYILITMINKKWPTKTPIIENLSGKVNFSKDDIRRCKKTWPRIRDFKSLNVNSVKSTIGKKTSNSNGGGLISDFNTIESMEKSHEPQEQVVIKSVPRVKSGPPSEQEMLPEPEQKSQSNLHAEPEPAEEPEALKLEQVISTPVKRMRQKLDSVDLSPPSETQSLYFSPTANIRDYNSISPTRTPSFKPRDTELLSRTPHLEYSPLKSTSLSYYSPSITRYLTYDTNFYMRRSQARERDVDFYQSYKYEPVAYSPQRKQKMSEVEFLDKVVRIQSTCRGANTRFDLRIQLRLLKLFEREVISFQSFLRGRKKRSNTPKRFSLKLTAETTTRLHGLQSILRGFLTRSYYDSVKAKLSRHEASVNVLQSMVRGIYLRRSTCEELSDRHTSEAPLRKLQALVKGNRSRHNIVGTSHDLQSKLSDITKLQGVYRGSLFRKRFIFACRFDGNAINHLSSLQELVRGVLKRNLIYRLLTEAKEQEHIFLCFSAHMRGNKIRNSFVNYFYENAFDFHNIQHLQGVVRGVLVRYTLDLVDDIIESNALQEFQANARGLLLRSRIQERTKFYKRNERSVIALQSRIRTFQQREAYLDLMHYPNPNLQHVKKFAYLLNNIGTIEENQDKLEACQAQLDSENLKKENFEKNIRQQLDTGDVLEKYKLTSGLTKELQGMDIPFCRYPMFEKLFFLLQVDPSYWKVLYTLEPEFVEKNMYVSFTTVNQRMGRREKIYFIRLLAEILQLEVTEARSMEHFLSKRERFWNRMLRVFLKREYTEVFALFAPLLNYITNPKVKFESDPYIIYKEIHRSDPIGRSEAIEDQKTKLQFIENLRSLWHAIEMTAEIFTRKLKDIPMEVRFIGSKMFTCAADKNTDEIGTLRALSAVLVNCFISEFMLNRRFYGFESNHSPEVDKKMESYMKALEIVFGLGRFSGYYDPLNQYAEEINLQVRELLFNIILDPSFEQEGDTLIYRDMVSASPQLEILTEKVLSISMKFKEHLLEFPEDDVIHEILKRSPNGKDLKKSGRVILDLTASAYRFLVCDDRMRKVYDQVKRALIYMMQVEDIQTNLYDLIVSSVLPQDEPNFKALVNTNPGIKSDPMIRALQSPKYFNLKNITLKKLNELEHLGIIKPTSNKLQNFLNDIANTIKNPHYTINYVTQELYLTEETLKGISKINRQLERTLSNSRSSVNEAIRKLLKSRDFNPGHKSALDNLKGAYKKVQTKRNDKLEGNMKFKWTTRQLYEKGVVKSIESENLAEQKVKVFGSSGPKFPDINFKISTSDGSTYWVQLLDRRKGIDRAHLEGIDSFTFRDLLATQVGSKADTWKLLNGKVVFNTSQLLTLVINIFLT
ncbi:IQG1 (YPL242C) [Zygosaccharomyces parabailii]|nr:IQG1 (YPL242C) [Zygosaccharomyces parabailii]